jgi:hypothetical protein
MLADPRFPTSFEILFKFPSDPRGTPSPAESFWKTKFPGVLSLENTTGLAFDNTSDGLAVPATGADGAGGRSGLCTPPFVTGPVPAPAIPVPVGANPPAVILFNPFHVPPGCQPHPYPGKNDHDPE